MEFLNFIFFSLAGILTMWVHEFGHKIVFNFAKQPCRIIWWPPSVEFKTENTKVIIVASIIGPIIGIIYSGSLIYLRYIIPIKSNFIIDVIFYIGCYLTSIISFIVNLPAIILEPFYPESYKKYVKIIDKILGFKK